MMEAVKEKSTIHHQTALHVLLASLIDYAGLFPPAGLTMQRAVENYARYKADPHAWMLGRFVVPVVRLTEFEQAWETVGASGEWQLSGLVSNLATELTQIDEFNAKHDGRIEVDAVEIKASTAEDIAKIGAMIPLQMRTYVEIPADKDRSDLIAAIKRAHLRAKIRTGGLTGDLFPETIAIARFLRACADAEVPFKATAGLHHPVRCVRPFTYEPESPRGKMHGFLNVFLAAAHAQQGKPVAFLERLLTEENASAFQFASEGLEWKGEHLTTYELASTRKDFAIAFGSCSFEEPISDLKELGLLP